MLQDDFSYFKATNICCMDLIFRNLFSLSTLVFTYLNASILTILNTWDLYSSCATRTQWNWQWRDFAQIKLSRENHKQGLKIIAAV